MLRSVLLFNYGKVIFEVMQRTGNVGSIVNKLKFPRLCLMHIPDIKFHLNPLSCIGTCGNVSRPIVCRFHDLRTEAALVQTA